MRKKPRSLQELQHQRDHYLKILSGLNPDSATMIRRQIDKLFGVTSRYKPCTMRGSRILELTKKSTLCSTNDLTRVLT